MVLEAVGSWPRLLSLGEAFGYDKPRSIGRWWRANQVFDPEHLIGAEKLLGLQRHKVRPDLFAGYRRAPEPVRWQRMPEDRGWAKVVRAAGGGRVACYVLAPYLEISPEAIAKRRHLEIEWLVKIERLLGLPRHELRPDLYSGYYRVSRLPSRDPAITAEIDRLTAVPGKRLRRAA